jgi:hypothetical protein
MRNALNEMKLFISKNYQVLQDYRDRKRAPVLGPLTYAECFALVEENNRLLAALDAATHAGTERQ